MAEADPITGATGTFADFQEYLENQRKLQAAGRVYEAADKEADPKRAAKAVKLEQITGQDGKYIYGNYDHFVNDQKSSLTEDLLNKDMYLREYVLSHPLAATVSKDDWGPLSDYSQSLQEAQGINEFHLPKGTGEVFEGFRRGFETGWKGTPDVITEEDMEKLGLPEFLKKFIRFQRGVPGTGVWGADFLAKIFPALTTGLAEGGAEAARQFGYDETTAARTARNLYELATILPQFAGTFPEAAVMQRGAQWQPYARGEALKGAFGPKEYRGEPRVLEPKEVAEAKDSVTNMLQRISTFTRANELPPLGADRIMDLILGAGAAENFKIVDGLITTGDKTNTKQLSMEMFQKLTELALKGNVALNYDEVRALYGDKVPEPGDGLLGDISGVIEQFEKNDRTGKEIEVPTAEYVTKVSKEVWKALRETTRLTEDGATIREFERFQTPEYQASRPSVPRPEIEGYEPKDVVERAMRRLDDVRTAAGVEPYFAREAGIPPKRLQLAPSKGVPYPALKGEHSFTISDEIGRHLADLELTPSPDGKNLEVNWIGGHVPMHQTPERLRNMFGPGLVRDLLRQVQEQFPDAKTISGVKLGREGELKDAGPVSIDIARALTEPDHVENFRDVIESGNWIQVRADTAYLMKPTELWTSKEKRIFADVDTLFKRILPEWAKTVPVHGIMDPRTRETGIRGTYVPPSKTEGVIPTILWAINKDDPIGTARHEAIHFLRRQGFITQDEWRILVNAAIEGKWINKHGIAEDYKGLNLSPARMLEEAIAEEYSSWAKSKDKDKHSGNTVYQKLQRLLLTLEEIVRKHFGGVPTADDLFENIEAGRIGSRENREASINFRQYWPDETAMRALSPEDQELKKAEARAAKVPKPEEQVQLFEPGVITPKRTHEQYTRTIQRWWGRDDSYKRQQLIREEKKRLAPEWKENWLTTQQEVTNDFKDRPDFKVQRFFQYGEFRDIKTTILPKLDPKYIWPEQLESIPKQYLAEGGLDPARIAGEFGYPDGYSMVADMAELGKARGPEGFKAYLTKLIKDETDRRMEAKYGTPEAQALQSIRDEVSNHSLFDVMHQDVLKFLSMAEEAGHTVDKPISQKDMIASAWQAVLEGPIGKATLKESYKELGRIFRELDEAYASGRGDPVRAYKLSQRRAQEFAKSMVLKTIEKEKAAFERAMKAGYKRDPTGMPFDFAARLHEVMTKIGREVDRHPDDLARALNEQPTKSLQEFANRLEFQANGVGEDEIVRNPKLPVYDKLNDPSWTVDIDKTNVGEFREINNTVQALITLGRDQNRVTILGKRMLVNDAVDALVKQMQTFSEYGKFTPKKLEPALLYLRTVGGGLLKWTTRTDRYDQFDRNGPWTRYIKRPFERQAAQRDVLERDHSRMYQNEMKKVEGIKDYVKNRDITSEVPQDLIHDPNGWDWKEDPKTGKHVPYISDKNNKFKPMTDENLIMAIVYYLEPTARDVLARGHLMSELQMQKFLWTKSKKIHWDIADKIGAVFERFAKEEDEVSKRMNGSFIKRLPLPDVESPFGTVRGRYYPLVYDTSVQTPKGLKVHPTQGFMTVDKDMFKERTGYAAPLDLTLNTLDHQMKRRVDFIAWEELLDSFRKIAQDPKFDQALRVYHGPHIKDSFSDWIKDIPSRPGTEPASARAMRAFFNFMTSRSVGSSVGFRTSTIGKHVPSAAVMGAGEAPYKYPSAAIDVIFHRTTQELFQSSPESMQSTHNFVDNGDPSIDYKGSAELKSRGRRLKDSFGEAVDYSLGKIGPVGKFRDGWNQISSGIFLGLDNFFSRITQWSKFKERYFHYTREEGYSYADAVHAADTDADEAVRVSHGSRAVASLPEYLRQQDPLFRNTAALFAFWSNDANRIFLSLARTKEMALGRRNKTLWSDFSNITTNFLVYGLAPMIIEDLVEPICNREESNMVCAMKWGGFAVASRIPAGRELAWAAITGTNPGYGIVGSTTRAIADVGRTAKKLATWDIDKIDWGRTLKSSLFLASFGTGLVGGLQAGLVADYVWKLNHEDEELPKTPEEYARLLFSGKVQERRGHEKQNIWGRLFGEGPR